MPDNSFHSVCTYMKGFGLWASRYTWSLKCIHVCLTSGWGSNIIRFYFWIEGTKTLKYYQSQQYLNLRHGHYQTTYVIEELGQCQQY